MVSPVILKVLVYYVEESTQLKMYGRSYSPYTSPPSQGRHCNDSSSRFGRYLSPAPSFSAMPQMSQHSPHPSQLSHSSYYSPPESLGFPEYSEFPVQVPPSNSSFASLQMFCQEARSNLPEERQTSSLFGDMQFSSHVWLSDRGSIAQSDFFVLDDDQEDEAQEQEEDEEDQGGVQQEDAEEEEEDNDDEDYDEDDGWFDLEMMGENGEHRFEFPVPMEPAVPVEELEVAQFEGGHTFYCDAEGYVQVYTQGEGRNRIDRSQKASIGVWFGPDHPSNVSERLYRGRRTQEAARFAAVIEAIRVAGSCGVTHLQINTDYINVVRFMLYFILKWEQNGWMTIRGTPVKNQVLIRELDYFSRLMDVKWNYVPVEEEAEGNIQANILCQSARSMVFKGVKQAEEPEEPEPEDERPKEFDSFIPLAEPTTHTRTPAQEEILAARKRRFAPY